MIGALYRYMNEADPRHFQPMNANFGLLDELTEKVRDKKQKREMFSARALRVMNDWIEANGICERAADEVPRKDRGTIQDLSNKFGESVSLSGPT